MNRMKSKDIKNVFENNPELNKIGNKIQYYKYLKTIFPESKVKEMVYHRGPEKIEIFDKSKIKKSNHGRFYFSPINTRRYGQHVTNALLDIKNLAKPGDKDFINELNKKHPEYTKGKSEWFHLPAQIYANADKYGFDGVFDFEGTNDDEYSVYHPEQIHILGSKKDLEGFKRFIKNQQSTDSLEKRVVSSFFILSIILGLFASTSIITGNVVNNTPKTSLNFLAPSLIAIGIIGFLFTKKYKK
jgi:hypothetical protein